MPNEDPWGDDELSEERVRRKRSVRRFLIWTGVVVAIVGITGFTLKDLITLPWGRVRKTLASSRPTAQLE